MVSVSIFEILLRLPTDRNDRFTGLEGKNFIVENRYHIKKATCRKAGGFIKFNNWYRA
jgi:hypothetical protein